MTKTEGIKGYKVFNADFKCRDFQYEVGKTYTHKGKISLCNEGFHFCNNLKDCFNYYSFVSNNKVAEIVALGKVVQGDDKSVTDKIKIVREITWHDVLEMVNTGKDNTGRGNTGNFNTGDRNTGDCNTGCRNTGHRNTGDFNTGLFNSCDYSNGLFNSESPKIYMFNKPTKLTFKDFQEKYPDAYNLLVYSSFKLTKLIDESNMIDEEKEKHPEYTTTVGYLKQNVYKETCCEMWNNFTETQQNKIKELPNFDKDVFYEITGIEV